jgi:hypothetical protein
MHIVFLEGFDFVIDCVVAQFLFLFRFNRVLWTERIHGWSLRVLTSAEFLS